MNGSSSKSSRGILLHPAQGRTQLLLSWNAGELPAGVPHGQAHQGLLGGERIRIGRLCNASGRHATGC